MKIHNTAPALLDAHGVGQSTGFRIAASAHAFKMLSSGLYSDKISAVLREIGCNAADAHIAAGLRSTPIEIKLPNALDPLFFIRDRGLGLSDEQVRELYTTYFASTKQASNDFTGAFGLGSKSPFSYTDSFTVTSCHEGQMRAYAAHLDKQGSPVITLLEQQPARADWPTGVMISFPVRAQDFSEFQDKARQVYQWFSPQPLIRGLEDNWCRRPQAWFDGQSVALFSEAQPACVLMGNVRYPLRADQLFGVSAFRYGMSLTAAQSLAKASVMLKLPIGAVQVAASREELQYDDETKLALTQGLTAAADILVEEMGRRLVQAYRSASGWAQRLAVKTTHTEVPAWLRGRMASLRPLLESKFGLSFDEQRALQEYGLTASVELPTWLHSDDKGVTVKVIVPSGSRHGRSGFVVKNGQYERAKVPRAATIPVEAATAIYLGDCDKPEERLLAGMHSTGGVLIAVRARDKRAQATALAAKLAAELGGVPVTPVSSFPDVSAAKQAKAAQPMVNVLTLSATAMAHADAWICGGEETPLDALKATQKYYLVRDGLAGAFATEYLFEYLDQNGVRVEQFRLGWDGGMREFVAGIYEPLRKLGLEGTLPEGIVLVTPTQVTRLKLVENGFRPFLGHLRELVQSKLFEHALVKHGVDGLCRDFKAYRASAVESLLCRLREDESFATQVLENPLPMEDRLLLLAIKNARQFAAEGLRLRATLEATVGKHWQFFAPPKEAMTSGHQLCAELAERYPVLSLMRPDAFNASSRDNKMYAALRYVFAQLPEQHATQVNHAA